MSTILSSIITKIKGENYELDVNLSVMDQLGILFRRFMQVLRGLVFYRNFFKKTKGIMFIGRKVKMISAWKIESGKNLIIEDYTFINALSKKGIRFGDNVSIGRNSIIECTGVIRELGEGLIVGNNVGIAANAFIAVRGEIIIGDNTIIGPNVSIHAENHVFEDINIPIRLQGAVRKGVKIGEDCWIGSKVVILDGVTIGKGVVIAAGTVVNKDIPDFSIAGGVPAKVLKRRGIDL